MRQGNVQGLHDLRTLSSACAGTGNQQSYLGRPAALTSKGNRHIKHFTSAAPAVLWARCRCVQLICVSPTASDVQVDVGAIHRGGWAALLGFAVFEPVAGADDRGGCRFQDADDGAPRAMPERGAVRWRALPRWGQGLGLWYSQHGAWC